MATTVPNIVDMAKEDFAKQSTRADEAIVELKKELTEAGQYVVGLRVDYDPGQFNPDDVTPNDIPTPTLSPTDFSSEVQAAFDHAFNSHNADIQPQVLNFLDQFFPDIAESIRTGSDNWIIDTIANGRFVPADVENAIWNRERDRETQEALRAEQSILDATAARGFSAPPGVTLAAIAANQTELAKKQITLGREIAIKDFDLANENTKFAIQQAIGLRSSFVSALGDFIRIAMVQPGQATDYAKTILAAKTSLYDTSVRLYSAQIAEEEMRTNVLQKNKAFDLQYAKEWLDARSSITGHQISIASIKANTAVAAAAKLAEVASASLQTRNSMISVSGTAS